MLPHQKKSLADLIDRENLTGVTGRFPIFQGDESLHIHSNVGVYCDPIGSGKTRTLLALIEATCYQEVHATIVQRIKIARFSIQAEIPAHLTRATLIIAPRPAYTTVWLRELRNSSLYFREVGYHDALPLEEFDKYDVLLLSSTEADTFNHRHHVTYRRVIIDEFKVISMGNPPAARFTWLVSGAPALYRPHRNPFGIDDLYPLVSVHNEWSAPKFIEKYYYWPKYQMRYMKNDDETLCECKYDIDKLINASDDTVRIGLFKFYTDGFIKGTAQFDELICSFCAEADGLYALPTLDKVICAECLEKYWFQLNESTFQHVVIARLTKNTTTTSRPTWFANAIDFVGQPHSSLTWRRQTMVVQKAIEIIKRDKLSKVIYSARYQNAMQIFKDGGISCKTISKRTTKLFDLNVVCCIVEDPKKICGMSVPEAEAVFIEEMRQPYSARVIGMAQRIGRKKQLRVYRFYY